MGDLRDEKTLTKLPKDVDAVVHLAANARVYELVKDPDRARDNFLTTYNTIEFARKAGIKKFLFASSREVYGNAHRDAFTEDMVEVDMCESPYTASKIGGEALVHAYRRCYDLTPVILRFSNVYGMYDDSDRVIPLFIRLARKNAPLTIFGEGKCLDFTYIDDTVEGITLVLKKWDACAGRTINLAYGSGATLTDLAAFIKEFLGSTSPVTMAPPRTGEVTHYIADITQAKTLLGFSPKVALREGVKRTVEWYVKHT